MTSRAPDTTSGSRNNWREQAACRPGTGHDLDTFFPNGNAIITAKRICATCPVTAQCLADALAAGPGLIGIWGGTSEQERRRILRTDPEPTPPDHPEETRQQACDLWTRHRPGYTADGACARQIARQLGVTLPATILTWVREAGVAEPPKQRTRTPQERADAIDDYQATRDEHRSLTEALDAVGERHGVARSALRTWLVAAGLLDPPSRRFLNGERTKADSGA